MNKREVVWLIVRLIGLYLSYLGIVALFSLVSAIWTIASMPTAPKSSETEANRIMPEQPAGFPSINPPTPAQRTPARPQDPASDAAKRAAFMEILWYVFLTLLQGGIGIYFLFWGGILFNLLNRENKPGEVREREPESILLNLSD